MITMHISDGSDLLDTLQVVHIFQGMSPHIYLMEIILLFAN